jgi:hypothetical protein
MSAPSFAQKVMTAAFGLLMAGIPAHAGEQSGVLVGLQDGLTGKLRTTSGISTCGRRGRASVPGSS